MSEAGGLTGDNIYTAKVRDGGGLTDIPDP